ncbi:hypothetical protein P3T20_004025 [Paraburkholderia sp. GAS206C]
MASKQTINEFLLYTLGIRVTNRTWAWDAYGDDVVVMKLWKRRYFKDPDGTERIEVWAPPPWKKPAKAARNERRANIDRLKSGGTTYAVLREGEGSDDPNARDYESRYLYSSFQLEAANFCEVAVKIQYVHWLDDLIARRYDRQRNLGVRAIQYALFGKCVDRAEIAAASDEADIG